ncbi:transcriptional repressor [Rhodobacterales bacterium]|nr:transcriptional repressor [Rhodobacterales bacterium]
MTEERQSALAEMCMAKGMRMTEQRRVIASVIEQASDDHPDVEELYRRAVAIDPGISISTVYRTVKLFEDAGMIERHDFRDGRSRYEAVPDEHHDHLIDLRSGQVIEFRSEEIEALQEFIARKLGYKLVDHRLELYGIPLQPERKEPDDG